MLADPDTQVIGHNLQFDLTWMIDRYDGDLPFIRNTTDTMIQSQLLHDYKTKTGAAKAGYPGYWQPNDLASVLEERLGVKIGKEIDHETTDWTGYWSSDMIEYMIEDIVYLEKLADLQTVLLQTQGQERANWIEQQVVPATAWMTYNGFQPDVQGWKEMNEQWLIDRNHMLWHLIKSWPHVRNFNSPVQLMAAAAEDLGYPIQDTKKSTLKMLARVGERKIQQLLDFRWYATRYKNWGPKFLEEFVCWKCGRFHPNWRQIGTETSRFSCSRPNLQQIPREPEFRSKFVAAEGCVLASLDYSAIEVVTAAVYGEDKNLLEACRTGDPHRATAAMIAGLPLEEVTPDQRQHAKIANFGLLFGGGAQSLVDQARDLFDVTLKLEEAQKLMKDYFRIYTGLAIERSRAYNLHEKAGKRIEISNMVGFRRYLEGFNRKPTSILNTKIQSTAGHGLKSSFPYLMESGLLPFLCAQVHDEIVLEFPEEDAQDLTTEAQSCMLRGMHDVLGRNAPVKVDPKIAYYWQK